MTEFDMAVALFLLLTVVAGLVRVWRGPTDTDRMLAAQLLGSTGIGILLLLGSAMKEAAALNIALLFALLASLAGVAFVRRLRVRALGAGEEE
ncbi:MAG TPA: monovalent cation/H+ antiporter complex subunit F [Pedomonas sp.]|uniref:monovalent cation/H+ antiporter complex subunit F n=1 Tax=Pedomonas sp. TaxID=2976421 RepID=UPI002F3FF966